MKNTSLLALVLCAGLPALAQAPVSLNIADVATVKAGFLGQFQFQSNTDPILQGTSNAFVIRRARLYVGGTVGDKIEFSVDTDQPKTGQPSSNQSGVQTSATNANGMVMQDVVLTYKFCPAFYLDGGILTIDPNHNGLASSSRFLGNDTSAYASLQNGATNTVAGNREVGLSARGLLGSHFEYHLGVTNGLRVNANSQIPGNTAALPSNLSNTTMSSNNAMRVTLRGQYDLFDNEGAGYSTVETYFGKKKIVSFGLGYDRQDAYKQTTGDVTVDLPVNGGDVFSFDGNYWVYDGGTFIPTLMKQKDWSMQAAYLFKSTSVAPILRFEQRRFDNPGTTNNAAGTGAVSAAPNSNLNESRTCLGFAYYLKEQRANFKLFYNSIKPSNLAGTSPTQNSYHQITAQFQISAW